MPGRIVVPIRLGDLLSNQDGRMTFAVADDPSARVSVEQVLYEDLRADCDWSTASDDMTDHALGRIEQLAAAGDTRVSIVPA